MKKRSKEQRDWKHGQATSTEAYFKFYEVSVENSCTPF